MPTTMKSKNTEKNIRTSARSLFFKNGIAKTSVRQIAAASSTNLGSFTYYYKSKNELVQKIYEDVNNDIRALIVKPFDRPATLDEYMFMQLFQFKLAVLNDQYYELFQVFISDENSSQSVKDLYTTCNSRFSRHIPLDRAYFIMTSAMLVGMKVELIKLARSQEVSDIDLDTCLEFFLKEYITFINPAEVTDLDEYRDNILREFNTYYVDVVKEFTPVFVKTSNNR